MKHMKTTFLVAAVLGFLALSAKDAAAQAPVVSASAEGSRVTIQWSGVLGAQYYNIAIGVAPGVVNIGPIPVPNTFIVANPVPNGTYYVRVQACAAGVCGPVSNEVSVTVAAGTPPPAGCDSLNAPVLSVNVSGNALSFTWTPVAGAVGYLLEIGLGPGRVDASVNAGLQTSYGGNVGSLTGTFYARVKTANACNAFAQSQEVAFAVSGAAPPGPGTPPPGGGNRTPNPPPGQLLPVPNYGEAVMAQVAAVYRGDLANACGSRTYLYRLVNELRKRDTRWGLNWKRGHAGSLSTDIVTYNPTAGPDNGASQIYLFDVVGAICEGNYPTWINATHETWEARGNPICGTEWCAAWTIDPYVAAGFPLFPDGREPQ